MVPRYNGLIVSFLIYCRLLHYWEEEVGAPVITLVLGCFALGRQRTYAHILRAVSQNAVRSDSSTVAVVL